MKKNDFAAKATKLPHAAQASRAYGRYAKGERHEVRGETSNREQVRMTCGSDVSLEHSFE